MKNVTVKKLPEYVSEETLEDFYHVEIKFPVKEYNKLIENGKDCVDFANSELTKAVMNEFMNVVKDLKEDPIESTCYAKFFVEQSNMEETIEVCTVDVNMIKKIVKMEEPKKYIMEMIKNKFVKSVLNERGIAHELAGAVGHSFMQGFYVVDELGHYIHAEDDEKEFNRICEKYRNNNEK